MVGPVRGRRRRFEFRVYGVGFGFARLSVSCNGLQDHVGVYRKKM